MQSQSELRQTITNSIISALENGGLPPWRKPWADDPAGFGLATSLSTGQSYKGINQIILQLAAANNSWQSRWFGTFNQIRFAGGSVRQGQKATKVILWKPIERKRTNEQGKEVDDSFLVMREFCIFNAEQTIGLDQFRVGFAKSKSSPTERYDRADAVIASTGADVRFGGNAAFYNFPNDYIQLPHRHQFDSSESFYETAAHELCHWSEKRIGFDRAKPENTYAFAELVAEIGSCLMMGELHLPTTSNLQNHAAYLHSWLAGMNDDSRFIFKAAAQASKAVDFLMSFSHTAATTLEQVEEPVMV